MISPGIESILNVCGGEPCIVRSRIPVWLLEQARRLGTSEAGLLQAYPTLRAQDLANAWNYLCAHAEEIDWQTRGNEAHGTDPRVETRGSGVPTVAATEDAEIPD